MAQSTTVGPLTAEQLEQYHRDGYVLLESLFNADEIAEMGRESDRILSLCLNASIATGDKDVRLDVKTCVEDSALLDIRKLQPVKDLSDCFDRLTMDERLLAPMRQIMGCEPILMEEKLNYKQKIRCPEFLEKFNPPQEPDQFLLHHDWGYFRLQGYPQSIISSAIAIDECTHIKGPLRVIPGTHTREWPMKHPDPNSGLGLVDDSPFTEEDRVELTCAPGSVMVFNSMLLHDSVPNATNLPRRLMIYSHFPGSFEFPEDERNRWARTTGRDIEDRYRELVNKGEYRDVPILWATD